MSSFRERHSIGDVGLPRPAAASPNYAALRGSRARRLLRANKLLRHARRGGSDVVEPGVAEAFATSIITVM